MTGRTVNSPGCCHRPWRFTGSHRRSRTTPLSASTTTSDCFCSRAAHRDRVDETHGQLMSPSRALAARSTVYARLLACLWWLEMAPMTSRLRWKFIVHIDPATALSRVCVSLCVWITSFQVKCWLTFVLPRSCFYFLVLLFPTFFSLVPCCRLCWLVSFECT